MNKTTISVSLYFIITVLFLGCGIWLRQLTGAENMSYSLLLMVYIIPAAAFVWGILMAWLKPRPPLWLWPFLTGLWEFALAGTWEVVPGILDISMGELVFGGILYLMSALPAALGAGLYKLVHLQDGVG